MAIPETMGLRNNEGANMNNQQATVQEEENDRGPEAGSGDHIEEREEWRKYREKSNVDRNRSNRDNPGDGNYQDEQEPPRESMTMGAKDNVQGENAVANAAVNNQLEVKIVGRIRGALQNLTIVNHTFDELAIVVLLVVGLLSDFFSEHNDTEVKMFQSVYFTLAVSLIVVVTQMDNFLETFKVHTACGLLLGLKQMYEAIVKGLSWESVNINEDFKIFYIVLILPVFSKHISFGTAFIYLIYLSFNLYIANANGWILALVAVFLWQRIHWDKLTFHYKEYISQTIAVGIISVTMMYVINQKATESHEIPNRH